MTVIHRHADTIATPTTENTQTGNTLGYRALALLRIGFGLTFLWAFFDKLLALGFHTGYGQDGTLDRFGDAAWINGGSPTEGFLKFGADGPFQGFYNSIGGTVWADTLFMLALLGIGLALTLGIGMRVAAAAGFVLYVMMWTVALPPENHPVLDEHILGAISMVVLAAFYAGDTWGLGKRWAATKLVKEAPSSGSPLPERHGPRTSVRGPSAALIPPQRHTNRGLDTSIRMTSATCSAPPGPVRHVRHVLEVRDDVRRVLGQPFLAEPLEPVPAVHATRGPAQHLLGEVEARHPVEHDHVERGRGRALLAEPADVETTRVRTSVDDLVDRAWVPVEGEHDVPVAREQGVELAVGEAVRVVVLRQQGHQVDDVHEAHAEVRHVVAQQLGRRQRLLGRYVARARQHDVGTLPLGARATPTPRSPRRPRCGGAPPRG